jgi:hypothetical protein
VTRPGPHLLQVDAPPETFAPLLSAVAAAGLRAGWLELRPPAPPAPTLAAAAALGACRAVAAGGGTSVAVKPLRGAPVLRDLLREHFHGCALVLVSGAAPPGAPLPPRLEAEGDGWRIAGAPSAGDAAGTAVAAATAAASDAGAAGGTPPATAPLHLDTAGLVAALRRPRPWALG